MSATTEIVSAAATFADLLEGLVQTPSGEVDFVYVPTKGIDALNPPNLNSIADREGYSWITYDTTVEKFEDLVKKTTEMVAGQPKNSVVVTIKVRSEHLRQSRIDLHQESIKIQSLVQVRNTVVLVTLSKTA